VTEAHGSEQLAQGCYLKREAGSQTRNFWSHKSSALTIMPPGHTLYKTTASVTARTSSYTAYHAEGPAQECMAVEICVQLWQHSPTHMMQLTSSHIHKMFVKSWDSLQLFTAKN